MRVRRYVLPFTAIVGQEKMKKALILNAINPRIGGLLIRGEKGTGKSTAVRALADLLPEIEVVDSCPFNCNPRNPAEMCDICYEKYSKGIQLPIVK
ncbi:MAG TPA: magnesium chelatase, partial [Candidatus Korarchaeota archaeon]|nr:magnesium chelatase [Candidatus Korarchaeota archaeon]